MWPLYSLDDHVSAPGMTIQPFVLPQVVWLSSLMPSVSLGLPAKFTCHVPAPYHAVVRVLLPSLDTPSKLGSIGPGPAVPLPPRRSTGTVHPRSSRGRVPPAPLSSRCNGSGSSPGLGLT